MLAGAVLFWLVFILHYFLLLKLRTHGGADANCAEAMMTGGLCEEASCPAVSSELSTDSGCYLKLAHVAMLNASVTIPGVSDR